MGGGQDRERRAAAAVKYAPRPPAGSTLRHTATSMRCQTVPFTQPSCCTCRASPGVCAGRRGSAAVRRRRHLTSPAHHRCTLKRRRQGALPLYFSDNIPPSSRVCAWKLLQLLHRCEATGNDHAQEQCCCPAPAFAAPDRKAAKWLCCLPSRWGEALRSTAGRFAASLDR